MKYLQFVALIGLISNIHLDFVTCNNDKQPKPLKLDWIPFHATNKSAEDAHPLFTKEEHEKTMNNSDAQGRSLLGGLLGGVGGLLGGLLGGGGNSTGGGGGAVATEFYAKFSSSVSDGKGIASLVKEGVNLIKLFGLDPKVDHGIIIENLCSECHLFAKVGKNNLRNTGGVKIPPEDGLIIKFLAHHPSDHYVVQAHDLGMKGRKARWGKIDAYGGKAAKSKLALIGVRNDQLVRVMKDGDTLIISSEIEW